jgi:hypothetical protein
MPTKRTKIGPRKVNRDVPEWVMRYLEDGTEPEYDTPEHLQFVEWVFFDEPVPGLTDDDLPDHARAVKRDRERRRRAD